MDQIDCQIVNNLRVNGKLTNVELGSILHISSQAVGKRRIKLEAERKISQYTILSDAYKTAFIEVYLNNNEFKQFEKAILELKLDIEMHKISGGYCYMIILNQINNLFEENLEQLLNAIEMFARYKVNTSVRRITQDN